MPPTDHQLIITGPEEDLVCIFDRYEESSPWYAERRERAIESVRKRGCLEMGFFSDRIVETRAEDISAAYKRVTVAQIVEIKCAGRHWLLIWVVGKNLFH